MFKATLSNVGLFRDSLQAIAELINEGIFNVKEDGIYFNATDPTMVAMVDFHFSPKVFDNYKVEGHQEIGINLDNILSVLKRAKATDKAVFELDKETNKLTIILKGTSTRKFTIPILDIEKTETPSMKLDFPVTVEIKNSVLNDGIEDASIITDTVVLGSDQKSFQMSSEGDLSRAELNLEKGNSDLVKLLASHSVSSKFSLDYLKKIIKAAKLSETVKIQLGKDYPVKFTFSSPNKVEIKYVLAPRVED